MKRTIEYTIKETEFQWQKGQVYTFSWGNYELGIKYKGCLEGNETLEFQIGDLGILASIWAKITKKEPGTTQLIKIGELYPLGIILNSGEKFGLTPLELRAKGDEKDYIAKIKISIPAAKIKKEKMVGKA